MLRTSCIAASAVSWSSRSRLALKPCGVEGDEVVVFGLETEDLGGNVLDQRGEVRRCEPEAGAYQAH